MKKLITSLLIVVVALNVSAQDAQIIDRMEPSQWWVGMHFTEVQIMLHGKNIADYSVAFKDNALIINRVIKTDNPNYLFVYVETDGAKAGTYQLNISKGRDRQTLDFVLHNRVKNSANRVGFSSADAIYLIMPDRFANGNPANDNMPNYIQKVDRKIPGARHGGDIQGIIEKVPYIANLGMTAIWTTPVFECNDSEYSYHHYGTSDYYKVDERFGTTEDYKRLSEVCHLNNIKLIIDIVPNHCSTSHWWLKDLPAKDWFHIWENYTNTNYRLNPHTDIHASDYDKEILTKGWFVPTMPDFNLENPLMFDYLSQVYVYWIELVGIDGIRVDTYPYNDINLAALFIKSLRAEYPRITIVGECWLKTPPEIAFYQSGTFNHKNFNSQMQSVMDFLLKDVFETALTEEDTWDKGLIKFYNHFAMDFVYRNPNMIMNLLDNHDITRYSATIKKDVAAYKMALAILCTTRGYPQIYYGTEIMLDGTETGYEGARFDFPGGWKEDKRNAFTEEGRTVVENEIFKYLQKLLHFRKSSTALQSGEMKHFLPQDGTYIYFRYNDNQLVMVAVNNSKQSKTVDLERFNEMNIIGAQAIEVTSGQKYFLNKTLTIPARTVLVLDVK